MIPLTRTGAVVCVLSLIAGCGQSENATQSAKDAYLNDVILVEHASLTQSAKTLHNWAETFCASPLDENFQSLRDSWREAMINWQGVEAVSQVYMEENMEGWRFQFWPDKKNLVGRKVEGLLKKPGQDDVRGESVIVQGLSAIEYLLFDPKNGQRILLGEESRCGLLQSVSRSFQLNSQDLDKKWQTTGVFYTDYASQEEDKKVTVPVLALNSLDILSSRLIRELNLPIGKTPSGKIRVNHYLAESWRSGQSLKNITASLDAGMKMTAFVSAMELEENELAVWQRLEDHLSALKAEIALFPPSVEESLEQKGRDSLIVLNKQFSNFRNDIQNASKELGAPLGFNANDGD